MDFLEGPTTFPRRDHRLAQRSSGVQHTRIGEVQFTGPALQGPIPSNNTSIRALGFRYKGSVIRLCNPYIEISCADLTGRLREHSILICTPMPQSRETVPNAAFLLAAGRCALTGDRRKIDASEPPPLDAFTLPLGAAGARTENSTSPAPHSGGESTEKHHTPLHFGWSCPIFEPGRVDCGTEEAGAPCRF